MEVMDKKREEDNVNGKGNDIEDIGDIEQSKIAEDKKEIEIEGKKGETDREECDIESKEDEDIEERLKKDIDALKKKLEEKEVELEEKKDNILRIHAESENYKKRMQREMSNTIQFANEVLIKDLLPIIDNIERAAKADDNNWGAIKEGIQLTLQQIYTFLERLGVEKIAAIEKPFDPIRHEAIAKVCKQDKGDNIIIEEYITGYTLKNKVIRPSKVMVNKLEEKETKKDNDLNNKKEKEED